MTKSELIENVASENNLSKTEAKKVLESVLSNIAKGIANDGKVGLLGFGNFSTVERKARLGRNPQTGQPLEIAAKTVVKFKAQF